MESGLSEGENQQQRESISDNQTIENPQQWMEIQAPRRLNEALKQINIEKSEKIEFEKRLDKLQGDILIIQKDLIKQHLKSYNHHFQKLFGRYPCKAEKEPFRCLYLYYRKIKSKIEILGLSSPKKKKCETDIIKNIKQQRKKLRQEIEIYQQQFMEKNHRKIKYSKDIEPIKQKYEQYKELRRQIQKLQSSKKFQQKQEEINDK